MHKLPGKISEKTFGIGRVATRPDERTLPPGRRGATRLVECELAEPSLNSNHSYKEYRGIEEYTDSLKGSAFLFFGIMLNFCCILPESVLIKIIREQYTLKIKLGGKHVRTL